MATPLNHARILAINSLQSYAGATIKAGTLGLEDPGFMLTSDTYKKAKVTGSSIDIEFDFDLSAEHPYYLVDTFCIGATNILQLNPAGISINITGVDSEDSPVDVIVGYDTVPQYNALNNTSLMVEAPIPINLKSIKIVITGLTNFQDAYIGNMSVGRSLQFPRPFWSGYTPAKLNAEVSYYNATTETGNWVSRDVRKKGYSTSASWSNLPSNFINSFEFIKFVESAIRKPFYFSWNMLQYPYDTLYCSTDKVKPSLSGTRDYWDLSIDLKVHG